MQYNLQKNIRVIIKKPCYSVTIWDYQLLWAALNREIHKELIDTKFDDFR